MSTASPDPSSDQPQRTSHQPGPLALLAATAVGGILATRMGKTPFLLAAGAAAVALLRQKTAEPPPPTVPLSLPPPAPELDIPAPDLVEQWLSRQIIREEQAPVVEFSTADITPSEPEDDYHPESFLLDDADDVSSAPPDHDSFAGLSEPVPEQIPEPDVEMAVEIEEEAPPPAPPPQVFKPLQPPLPAADSAWTLGVEPLPSVNESAGAPYVAPAGSMFFSTPIRQEGPLRAPEPPRYSMFSSAPVAHEDSGPPPFFSTPVFEGAAFPDEISVTPPSEPAEPPPADEALPTSEPEPLSEPPPAVETTPEIPVEIAAPGEASFDPPLAAAPPNPWQPEPEDFGTPPAFPTHTQTVSHVVEAEIILRPRAPTQSTIAAKSKFAPPAFNKHFSAESSDTPAAETTSDPHFPGPLQSPREPTARKTWRSWWRGD